MFFHQNRAIELLRQGSGNLQANFRDGQEEAISHIVTGTQGLLVSEGGLIQFRTVKVTPAG